MSQTPEYITLKEVSERLGISYHRCRNWLIRDRKKVKTDGLFIHVTGSFLCKPEIVERLND